MIRLYAIALAAGLFAFTAVYQSIKSKGRTEGAAIVSARVEKAEGKTDAKIKKARKSVAAQPAASVLDKWTVD